MTAAALVFAFRLEAQLDVKDFFDSNSDFVVGLDKLDYHVGETQGEPGIIYIEGDLSARESLEALRELHERLRANPYVGQGADGRADPVQLDALRPAGARRRQRAGPLPSGVCHGAGHHGRRRRRAAGHPGPGQGGLWLHGGVWAYRSTQPRWPLRPPRCGAASPTTPQGATPDALQMLVALPGTREQSVVSMAQDAVEADLEFLEDVPSISRAGLTGSAFTRGASLDAAVRSLAHVAAHCRGVLLPGGGVVHALGALRPCHHHPHWLGGDLALRPHVPAWL